MAEIRARSRLVEQPDHRVRRAVEAEASGRAAAALAQRDRAEGRVRTHLVDDRAAACGAHQHAHAVEARALRRPQRHVGPRQFRRAAQKPRLRPRLQPAPRPLVRHLGRAPPPRRAADAVRAEPPRAGDGLGRAKAQLRGAAVAESGGERRLSLGATTWRRARFRTRRP